MLASRSPGARRALGAVAGVLSLRTIAIAVLIGFALGAGCGGCVGATTAVLMMRAGSNEQPPAAQTERPTTDPAAPGNGR
ncbi:MAG: hypothetical protein JJU33_06825 [Phycisphaerales bacterium]|nr:hypothetical protein [Phycisphaerales bacterium]